MNHGTVAGYVQHIRSDERPCTRCREANAGYKGMKRQIREAAVVLLTSRHQQEFQALLAEIEAMMPVSPQCSFGSCRSCAAPRTCQHSCHAGPADPADQRP